MSAWTLAASGTQTTTVGTEHVLSTLTSNATFMYEVDLTNMAIGDTVELRIKGVTLSGGATGEMWKATFNNAQAPVRVQTPAIPSDISITATLKQTNGTSRTYAWKVLSQ